MMDGWCLMKGMMRKRGKRRVWTGELQKGLKGAFESPKGQDGALFGGKRWEVRYISDPATVNHFQPPPPTVAQLEANHLPPLQIQKLDCCTLFTFPLGQSGIPPPPPKKNLPFPIENRQSTGFILSFCPSS